MRALFVRPLVAVALAIAVVGCAPPPPPDTSAADAAAMTALRDAWLTAYNAGDADAVANTYAEDAIDMPNEQPTASGRADIRTAIAGQLALGKATATLTSDEMQLMGDWAFDRGRYNVSIVPAAGGDPMSISGRYLVIARRQADGSFKLVRGIDNSATPPVPAAPAAGSGS